MIVCDICEEQMGDDLGTRPSLLFDISHAIRTPGADRAGICSEVKLDVCGECANRIGKTMQRAWDQATAPIPRPVLPWTASSSDKEGAK